MFEPNQNSVQDKKVQAILHDRPTSLLPSSIFTIRPAANCFFSIASICTTSRRIRRAPVPIQDPKRRFDSALGVKLFDFNRIKLDGSYLNRIKTGCRTRRFRRYWMTSRRPLCRPRSSPRCRGQGLGFRILEFEGLACPVLNLHPGQTLQP